MAYIQTDEIRIERLNRSHKISGFRSYEQELVDFLVEDALDNQDRKISVTYLWFLKEDDGLIGYVTLLNDRINLEGGLKEHFRDKGIFYKSLPALKIGRLCVDDRYLKRGIGKLMLKFAIITAERIYEKYAGCRFIVLDAKRNPDRSKDSIHFYRKIGLKILKERRKGTTPMYWDMSQ